MSAVRSGLRELLAAGVALLVGLAATGMAAACPKVRLNPVTNVVAGDGRWPAITPEALLGLRDIKGFAPSPDGTRLFVVEQQADAAANGYHTRWFVRPMACGAALIVLDQVGGAPAPTLYGRLNGGVAVEAPRWSTDGRFVAYRKAVGDQTQLWVARPDRGDALRVDWGAADVTAYAWTMSGVLIYETGLDRAAFQAAFEAERRHGFLYDDRFFTSAGEFYPMTPDCAVARGHPACVKRRWAVAFAGDMPQPPRALTPTQDREWAACDGPEALRQAGADLIAAHPGGAVAWAENQNPEVFKGPVPPRRLRTDLVGRPPCTAAACRGAFDGVWWSRAGRRVAFVKRESSRGGEDYRPRDITAVHLWDPHRARVTTLLRTNDALDHCTVAGGHLYCLLETVRRPARVVRLPLSAYAAAEVLYDPNPQVGVDERISIRKQVYTDELGNVGYYYRVMGPTAPGAQPRPAVVIQYRARGFLRGGTGDEYPILPIVQQGAMALVFDQANYPLDRQGVRNMTGQLMERHAHVATIEAALDQLVEEGLADPQRLAITGLSSGAENLHYALQRTKRFAAAIASSSPVELNFLAIMTPVYRSFKERYEATQVMGPNRILPQLAWTVQPERLHTPLLVNTTDREFLIGVEGFAALRDAGRPIEVRVFHDRAVHIKFDPANRAAVYALNLRWLDYWLFDRRDPAPDLAPQYARWTAMRSQLAAERGGAAADRGR